MGRYASELDPINPSWIPCVWMGPYKSELELMHLSWTLQIWAGPYAFKPFSMLKHPTLSYASEPDPIYLSHILPIWSTPVRKSHAVPWGWQTCPHPRPHNPDHPLLLLWLCCSHAGPCLSLLFFALIGWGLRVFCVGGLVCDPHTPRCAIRTLIMHGAWLFTP